MLFMFNVAVGFLCTYICTDVCMHLYTYVCGLCAISTSILDAFGDNVYIELQQKQSN